MNIEFLKFKKGLKKKDYQINPNKYWKMVLFVVFVIIALSFAYGFYLFLEINKEPVSSSVSTNDKIEKNRKIRIENFLQYFSDREKKSDSILNSPSPVVDPSI